MLNLCVIKCGGPPIVGRDWIDSLSLPMLGKVYSLTSSIFATIFDEFFPVFSTVLGCYKPETFKLYLNDNVKPVFCKPRIITFTLKDKVSNEIDRLVKDKLLIPAKTSVWATPVVPVVKRLKVMEQFSCAVIIRLP